MTRKGFRSAVASTGWDSWSRDPTRSRHRATGRAVLADFRAEFRRAAPDGRARADGRMDMYVSELGEGARAFHGFARSRLRPLKAFHVRICLATARPPCPSPSIRRSAWAGRGRSEGVFEISLHGLRPPSLPPFRSAISFFAGRLPFTRFAKG